MDGEAYGIIVIVWPAVTTFAETSRCWAKVIVRDVACPSQQGGVPIVSNSPELGCVLESPRYVGTSSTSFVAIRGCRTIQPRQMQDFHMLCRVFISQHHLFSSRVGMF